MKCYISIFIVIISLQCNTLNAQRSSPIKTSSNVELGNVTLAAGDSLTIKVQASVTIDSLIMGDSSVLILVPQTIYNHDVLIKWADIGLNCRIDGQGMHGKDGQDAIPGKDGVFGESTYAERVGELADGTAGGSGINLMMRIESVGYLRINLSGGNGGSGGEGADGGTTYLPCDWQVSDFFMELMTRPARGGRGGPSGRPGSVVIQFSESSIYSKNKPVTTVEMDRDYWGSKNLLFLPQDGWDEFINVVYNPGWPGIDAACPSPCGGLQLMDSCETSLPTWELMALAPDCFVQCSPPGDGGKLPNKFTFPYPVPKPAARIDRISLGLNGTVGDAEKTILDALEITEYHEIVYKIIEDPEADPIGSDYHPYDPGYDIPCDAPLGYAMITPLERIDKQWYPWGFPDLTNDNRFPAMFDNGVSQGLLNFLKLLFTASEGNFRVLVFVFKKGPVDVSDQNILEAFSKDALNGWLNTGMPRLDRCLEEVRKLPYDDVNPSNDKFHVEAFIYEFRKNERSAEIMHGNKGKKQGKQQFEIMGLWDALTGR